MKRRARPTSEGLAVLGLTVAIGAVGAASGNNLLYLLVGSLIGLWGIEVVLGSWNLRGVDAVRRLPAELVAEGDGSGRIVVRNRRRWMAAVALLIRDQGTQTEVSVDEVDPGSTGGSPAVWRFPKRGAVQLRALEIRSRFPFGWIEQQVTVSASAELVVYPRASTTSVVPQQGDDGGSGREANSARGGLGDFAGLRPYASGDRLHSVHWPTTARAGELMVVDRAGEAEPAVRVVLQRTPPDGWEGEISRAAGEIVRGFARGWRVGLELPSAEERAVTRLPARGGGTWRRALLEVLARLPEAE